MKSVFFVDDEIMNRKLFEKYMSDYDVTLDMAADGINALTMIMDKQYDLMFFDHMMPGITGLELLGDIKAMEDCPNLYTPCVALTANPLHDAEEKFLEAGFSAYLKKPISKASLEPVMRRFLPGAFPGAGEGQGDQSASMPATAFVAPDTIPVWLEKVDGLNPDDGVRINGNMEDYFESLKVFKRVSPGRKEAIEKAYEKEDYRNYEIMVHSLKSAAGIIGAYELSDIAEYVEMACANGEQDTVNLKHADLMGAYSRVTDLLDANILDIGTIENEDTSVSYDRGLQRRVVIISGEEHIGIRSIENTLKGAGCRVSRALPIFHEYAEDISEAELVVYYLDNKIYESHDFLELLKQICFGHGKGVILVGAQAEYDHVLTIFDESFVAGYFEPPLDQEAFIKKVNYYFDHYERKSRLRHRVLIVDDDEMYTGITKRWLEGSYDISVANSVVEAISCVNNQKPELILLDYEMPVTNGPQFLEIIRTDEGTANIPVIFLTGSRDKESVMRVLDLKPVGYLLKTIDKDTLLKQLAAFFSQD